jgi:hypothetical protein
MLDKVGPEQKDYYPYTPKPTSNPVQSKPDISLESLYGEQSLPSYTNMNNPGFGKVGRPKKKSDDYPIPNENFEGNPRGYGRKRKMKKSKSDSHLEGGMFSWLFGNRNRVAPTDDVRLRRILTNSTERNRARIAPIDTEAMPVLEGILPIGNANIDNRRPGTPFDPNHTLPEGSIVRRGRGMKRKMKKSKSNSNLEGGCFGFNCFGNPVNPNDQLSRRQEMTRFIKKGYTRVHAEEPTPVQIAQQFDRNIDMNNIPSSSIINSRINRVSVSAEPVDETGLFNRIYNSEYNSQHNRRAPSSTTGRGRKGKKNLRKKKV